MIKRTKRLLTITLVIMLIFGVANTAMAYYYSGTMTTDKPTDGSIPLITSIKDYNNTCYWRNAQSSYQCQYTSKAFRDGVGNPFSTIINSSGLHITHPYVGGPRSTGHLHFYNTELPGYTIVFAGNMY